MIFLFLLSWPFLTLLTLAAHLNLPEKHHHKVQHGHCSYTFLLPEIDNCHSPSADYQVSNSLQRDAPARDDHQWPINRIRELENIMENNTQWLLKVGAELIQCSYKVNNKILQMDKKHREEIELLRAEKLHVDELLSKQSQLIGGLGEQLSEAMHNNSMLQRQQEHIMETVGQLTNMVLQYNHIPVIPKEEQLTFRDCADAYKAGLTSSGVYTLHFSNSTESVKVSKRDEFCDMDTSGGGWTIIQHRRDGSVDFHRNWKEYKEGFGSPTGEYWLGNEFVHQLTSQGSYSLKIQLQDWDGNEAYSLYDVFSLGSEENNYRINVIGYSGTAGRTSSFAPTGTYFSTKDVDNDGCSCKCAQYATGGWWFDACGPSNLNGIYYKSGSGPPKYNSIKWHYWKGPSHGLKSVSMLIRPKDY
ncbi:hypothetical protein GDO81_005971 [Engystomops pustulosus]|uniref:Fibrinogen C-terminal domain-containing protein n=1 Tax=Engystomops pustulosus TaxID=76066 RepID=A0AAV7CTM6_ENGPU|nr:hypothetical protein GDO81_005971 [Engystomops pustulosus]